MAQAPKKGFDLLFQSRQPVAKEPGATEGATGGPEAAAEAVARRSYGRLVALLASWSGDVADAEDALADAFAAALANWHIAGIPGNPEAWLLVTARRRILDSSRRAATALTSEPHLRLLSEETGEAGEADGIIPDRRLALMFACTHPAITPTIRAPLILQTLLGFDAAAIASAFLVSPAAMAQRLARAKRKIRDAAVPLCVPDRADLPDRLTAVLAAIYAAYSEGWADATGIDRPRGDLASEAIWLGRLVHGLMPGEPEVSGLLALMLYAESRRSARRDADGSFVPLERQNTASWDHVLVDEAEGLLVRANREAGIGRFQLEAAIQSVHASRHRTGRTDWPAIIALYSALLAVTASPVVAVNRAAAQAAAGAPETALRELDRFMTDPRMISYQPFWAARAAALAAVGHIRAADAAYGQAIGLEPDQAVRVHLFKARAANSAAQS